MENAYGFLHSSKLFSDWEFDEDVFICRCGAKISFSLFNMPLSDISDRDAKRYGREWVDLELVFNMIINDVDSMVIIINT